MQVGCRAQGQLSTTGDPGWPCAVLGCGMAPRPRPAGRQTQPPPWRNVPCVPAPQLYVGSGRRPVDVRRWALIAGVGPLLSLVPLTRPADWASRNACHVLGADGRGARDRRALPGPGRHQYGSGPTVGPGESTQDPNSAIQGWNRRAHASQCSLTSQLIPQAHRTGQSTAGPRESRYGADPQMMCSASGTAS